MAFDCTQALDVDFEDVTCNIHEKVVVGSLVVGETRHDVFTGVNVIGRDAATCDIVLDCNVLSKQHATIEVKNKENHLIYDMGSLNKTRIDKMVLEPQVRYNLEAGTNLYFGNIHGQYLKICHLEDSSRETTLPGKNSLETLKNSVNEEECNEPAIDSREIETRSTISIGTVICKEEDSENVDDDDNIFDLETQCDDDGNVDADDPIFDMQTQVFEEDTCNPTGKPLTLNENNKDRSLLEDDADIFDSLVLEESHEVVPCTAEGKVEKKQLLDVVIQASDDSGDETDPENMFMEKTQILHTETLQNGDSKEVSGFNCKLNEKESRGNLFNNTYNQIHDSISEMLKDTKCPALISQVKKEIKQESIICNKSLLVDDADSDSDTDTEGFFSTHIQRVKYDTVNNSTHKVDTKNFCNSVSESRDQQLASHDVTSNTTEQAYSVQSISTENLNKIDLSSRCSIGDPVTAQTGTITEMVHEDTDNIMDAPTQIINDDVIVGRVVHQDICAASNDDIDDISISPTNATSDESYYGKVIHQDILTEPNKCFVNENVFDLPTQIVNDNISGAEVAQYNTSVKGDNTYDLINAPTQNDIAIDEVVQHISARSNVMCDGNGTLTKNVNNEVANDKLCCQSSSTALDESGIIDDVHGSPTQVVNDNASVNNVIHHKANFGMHHKDASIEHDMNAQNQIVNEVVSGGVHQTTFARGGGDVEDIQQNHQVKVVNDESAVGKKFQRDALEKLDEDGDNEDIKNYATQTVNTKVIFGGDIQQITSAAQNGDDIDYVQQTPQVHVASDESTVGNLIHQNTSSKLNLCSNSKGIMDVPTQIVNLEASINGITHQNNLVKCELTSDVKNVSAVIVNNEATVEEVVHEDVSVSHMTNAPTQIVTDEVIIDQDVQQITSAVQNGDDVDKHHHPQMPLIRDEFSFGKVIHQNAFAELNKDSENEDIMNAPTQIVNDDVIVGEDLYQTTCAAEDVDEDDVKKNSQLQFVSGKSTVGKTIHHNVSIKLDKDSDSEDIMETPTQIVNDSVIDGDCVNQTISAARNGDISDSVQQNTKLQVVSNSTVGEVIGQNSSAELGRDSGSEDIMDVPTQIVNDRVIVGEDVQQTSSAAQNGDEKDDVQRNSQLQIVSGRLSVGIVIHQEASLKFGKDSDSEDVMETPTQIVNDGVISDDIQRNTKIQVVSDTSTIRKVSHLSGSAELDQDSDSEDIMDTPTQNVNDRVIVVGDVHGTTSAAQNSDKGDVQSSSQFQDISGKSCVGEVIHQKALIKVNKDRDSEDIMETPTQIVNDGVIGDDIQRNTKIQVVSDTSTIRKVSHQNGSLELDKDSDSDDIMDAPTQIVNVEVIAGCDKDDVQRNFQFRYVSGKSAVGKVIHQKVSLKLEKGSESENIMDTPTQIVNDGFIGGGGGNKTTSAAQSADVQQNIEIQVASDELIVGKVIHQDISEESDKDTEKVIMDTPTQIMNDGVVHQTTSTFPQMQAVSDESTIGKLIHQHSLGKIDMPSQIEDIVNVPTQQIENFEVNVGLDGRDTLVKYKLTNDVKSEATIDEVIHKDASVLHDIAESPTQIVNDGIIVCGGVDETMSATQDGDDTDVQQNHQMQVVGDDRPLFGKVIHQDHPSKLVKYSNGEDMTDIATQVVNYDVSVNKTSCQNKFPMQDERNSTNKISSAQMQILKKEGNVGEIIHQNTNMMHVASNLVNAPISVVSYKVTMGQVIHQDTTAVFNNCVLDDVIDASTQVTSEFKTVPNVADCVLKDVSGSIIVSKPSVCKDRSVGSIIHQDTALVHSECIIDDLMDAPTQILHEERSLSKDNLQNNSELLVQRDISFHKGTTPFCVVVEVENNSTAVHQNYSDTISKNGSNDNAVERSNEISADHVKIISEEEMSPVLSRTKHDRVYQDKQLALSAYANSCAQTRSMKGIEVLSSIGNNVQHLQHSLKTNCTTQHKNIDEGTVIVSCRKKTPRTYSSKKNVDQYKSVSEETSVNNVEVSLASSSKMEPLSLDIARSAPVKQSNKRIQSQEESETRNSKRLCGGIESSGSSGQVIWPGKHQTYPGKRQSSVTKKSTEADCINKNGKVSMSEKKLERTQQCSNEKTSSLRKRKYSSVPDRVAKDSNDISQDDIKSNDKPVQAESLYARPKRNRKMTWKMIELEKTSPTSIKTETQDFVENSHGQLTDTLPTKVSNSRNVARYSLGIHDDKNHVVEGSVSQNMIKDCSPLGKLIDKSSVCTRKLSSEITSAKIVNDDTPKLKKKCSPSSSTRNNVSAENIKIQKEEKIPIISSCSPLRQTSSRKFVKSKNSRNKSDGYLPLLTSEENDEKMQGSSKYRQNRVKEKLSDSAKEEVNETLQKSKINKNNKRRQTTCNEEILLKSDANTSSLQTQLIGTTEELTEGANQKKLRGNKFKVNTQNDVKTNPSIGDKGNIKERKGCNRDSQKMLTKEGSLPKKEEESNGIMHKNKVNTRSSLNKDSVSTAGTCAKVPDMHSTNNAHKQTIKYSESFGRSFDGGKNSVESKINSSNKKQKVATEESINKRCLQTEELVNKSRNQTITAVDVENLNLSRNSQRHQEVTDTHSRKWPKKSSLPKEVDNSCAREDKDKTVIVAGKTKVHSSQLSSVKKGEASAPAALRIQLKRLTNIGKRQSSPKKSAAPAEQTRVMFTGLSGEQLKAQEAIVERLGGSVVDQPGVEMVLVAQKLCRTIKMLCAIARGIPIVNCSWLVSCSKKNLFVGTDDFTLHDKEGEKKFKMSLSKTLLASAQHPLLAGYTVMVTPHVVPVPKDMKVLVESCGGAFVARSPRNWPSKAFVISSEEDKSQWQKLRKVGVSVVSPEVILTGVLQHKIDLTTHQLGCT